ncbi:MAG: hypothetical protein NTY45_12555 [Elusimicrobia bacterium]|nr:hypothetical protein [Elusimicrobiota bacterium]
MKAEPGSWPWLLRHELRVSWRGVGGSHNGLIAGCAALLWACMHWGAWVALPVSYGYLLKSLQFPLIPGGLFWVLISLTVSQTMMHTVNALITRGDMDLLLSSPLSQRSIFMVRGISIAVSACILPAFALSPVANVGLLRGMPGLAAIYPVLISAALGCAAAGMFLTMTLWRLLGARRARTAAQVFAAFIGAGFFLVCQAPNLLSQETRLALAVWLKAGLQPGGWLGAGSPLWWPVHAMFGEPLPLLAVMAAGIGGFWLVVNLTYRRFITGTQEAVTGGSAAVKTDAVNSGPAFRSGLTRILIFKEWKLIARDMQVISQTLIQVLYLVPLFFICIRSGPENWRLLPPLVACAAMLAGNVAWLTINAEDAPDLVATAPVSLPRVLWIKAAAAVLPVLAALLPLAAWWAVRDPLRAAELLLCGTGAMLSAAAIQVWNLRPASRGDMKKRMKKGDVVGYIELLSTMGWAGIVVCVNGYRGYLPAAAAVVAVSLLSAWQLGRAAREALCYGRTA